MAHPQGTSARSQRLIALLAASLIAVATALAFGRVFLGHSSTWRLIAVGLASAAVASALERRNLVLATVGSGVLAVVAVGLVVFPQTTWYGLPTLETLRHMAEASHLVGEQARVQVSPAPPLAPLILAAVVALWAAVFSSHALAFRAGSPLLALVPPIALLAFADSVLEGSIHPFYGLVFLAAALAVIFADALRRVQAWGPVWVGPGSRSRLSRTAGYGARRVAAAAIAVAAIAPVIVPGFGSKAIIDLSTTPNDARVRIDPLVSIKDSLSRRAPIEVFRVTSSAPAYWRMLALPDFDGSNWRPDPASAGTEFTPETQLTPSIAGATPIQQTFRVSNDLELPWIPAAYPPQQINIPGVSVTYDQETGTVLDDSGIKAGTQYQVTSLLVQPTPAQLAAETFPTPAQNARYTRLPSDLDPRIAQIARSWTAGLTSDYLKILAVQDHLLSPAFRYDASVPARDDSFTILDFLTKTRAGFCQQFSSSMAVLLRSLGIPARVAVGFTSGTYDPQSNSRIVTTDQAHAWVEVLFPDYGWLAFEPTPGRTNPVALPYTHPDPSCLANPQSCDNGAGGGSGTVPGSITGAAGGLPGQLQNLLRRGAADLLRVGSRGGRLPDGTQVPVARGRPQSALAWLILAVAAIVGLLMPVIRGVRRRLHLHRASREPRTLILATYDVFTQRAADLGYPRGPGETIEEYRRKLDGSSPEGDGGIGRLSTIAGRAAYAPEEPGEDDARGAREAADTALRGLRKGTSLPRRLSGSYRLRR